MRRTTGPWRGRHRRRFAAGALAVTGVFGSSHREAPSMVADPTADDTDVYAFTADDAPGSSPSSRTGSRWRIPRADRTSPSSISGALRRQDRQLGDGYDDIGFRYYVKGEVPEGGAPPRRRCPRSTPSTTRT